MSPIKEAAKDRRERDSNLVERWERSVGKEVLEVVKPCVSGVEG
jgi:hypothetical protein